MKQESQHNDMIISPIPQTLDSVKTPTTTNPARRTYFFPRIESATALLKPTSTSFIDVNAP